MLWGLGLRSRTPFCSAALLASASAYPGSSCGVMGRTLPAARLVVMSGGLSRWQSACSAYGSGHLRQHAFCYWVKALGSGTLPFPGVKPSCQPLLAGLSGRHKGFLLQHHLAVALVWNAAPPCWPLSAVLPSPNASPPLKLPALGRRLPAIEMSLFG